jgi:hypothetical protein
VQQLAPEANDGGILGGEPRERLCEADDVDDSRADAGVERGLLVPVPLERVADSA